MRTRPQATCHPDQPHCALGLCKKCYVAYYYKENREEIIRKTGEWAQANKDRRGKWRLKYNDKQIGPPHSLRYGITREQWEAMWKSQDGGCAICGAPQSKTRRLSIDHCHITGVFRGLLCGTCNTGIGHLNDDPILVEKALEYLRKERNTSGVLARNR